MTAGFIAAPTIVPLKAFFVGGRKNHVDTTTRIELASGTEGVVLYYTVNGRRPAPYDRPRPRHTLEYHTPFTLSAGKVTIKALAVSSDRLRESSVVTKTFFVEAVSEREEEEEEEEERGGEVRKTFTLTHTHTHTQLSSPQRPSSSPIPPPLSLSAQLRHRISLEKATLTPSPSSPLLPPPTTSSSTATSPEKSTTTIPKRAASAPTPARVMASTASAPMTATSYHIPSSSVPSSLTPLLRCSYCKMPHAERSGHLYCSQCGTSLPSLPQRHRQPPTQMSVCSDCGVRVQSDTQHCPTCDSTAIIKPRTPSTIRGQPNTPSSEDAIMCSECGTRNTSHQITCLTCDATLHPSSSSSPPHSPSSHSLHHPAPSGASAPVIMRPITAGQSYAMCARCGRVNVSDARFCDWCGSKAGGSQVSVECGGCNATVDWLVRHCTNCGAIIRAPLRSGVERDSTMKMPAGLPLGREGWIPVVDMQEEKPVMINRSSQTDRFYPSAQTLSKRQEAVERQVSTQAAARDRVRKLNSFSPGRGLWRVQVDHVCIHLKAHSLSSHSFQNAIGSPVMGKLLHSEVVKEDNTVNIKLQFSLKEEK